ncbi:MAG: ZIP family metal transporter [Actinomycetota bacterium]
MATATSPISRLPNWVTALAPLLVIAVMIVGFVALNPIGSLREVPPVEAIAIERTILEPNSIELKVRNDGPDEVTIAQVLVNDAYWTHSIDDRKLGRLESETLTIPYPWDEGLPVNIALVTESGVTIEHEIEAAVATPEVDGNTVLIYALLGLYIGVIPVAIGLLWFPALRRASKAWIGFLLALTVGLLAFLLIDTIAEGLEIGAEATAAFDGVALFGIGALAAVLLLNFVEGWTRRKSGTVGGLALAYLMAAGIGLHNLGEGLAVGAALAAGEIALGTFLIIGFALHNTTEGLAIVSPLGLVKDRPPLRHFIALGAVAGVPTIFGAWAGGFVFSAAWGAFAFGIAAGAIAQVIWTITRSLPRDAGLASSFGALGFAAGLAIMYVTGLFTA